ncbi:MAG: radical SAM protein [Candidatus Altiarchaeota archaeon]
MDVLLIDPNGRDSLGLMSIQAFLKQHGFSSRILYAEPEDVILGIIGVEAPLVIGFNCQTSIFVKCGEIAKAIKMEYDVPILFGGIHPSLNPDIIGNDFVDILCRGEGEQPLLELVNALKNGNPIHDIPNLWVKKDGVVHKNPPRPLLENLDELPFPDRSDYYLKYPAKKHQFVKIFMAGRGCPFNCSFCFNHVYRREFCHGQKYRRWHSVDYVIREIKNVREKYGLHACFFREDSLLYSREWVMEFCSRYKEEIGMPFICFSSVKEMDEELVARLKDAGLVLALIGFETSNEELREKVLDKKFTNEEFIEKMGLLGKHGIRACLYVLHNIPGQTFEDTFSDMLFLSKVKPYLTFMGPLLYFPGLNITKYAEERNLIVELPASKRSFPGEKAIPMDYRSYNAALMFQVGVRWPFLIPILRALSRIPFSRLSNNPSTLLYKINRYVINDYKMLLLYISLDWKGFTSSICYSLRYSLTACFKGIWRL